MLSCPNCESSDIFCTYERTKVCKAHSSKHIGIDHYLCSISQTESHFLFQLNQKNIQKVKQDISHLELSNTSNKLGPFEIKNFKKTYLNLATKDDLNENVIPVIIDKNIWIVDLNKKIYKIVEQQIPDRYGFTMNIYKSRLMLIGGTDGLKKLEIIEDLFDNSYKLKLENPRCFHSSVLHKDSLYVIGGLVKLKNCFSIEVISFDGDIIDQNSYSDIGCKIIYPVSFVINTKIVTYFTDSLSIERRSFKKLEFDIGTNIRTVKEVKKDRDSIFSVLEKFPKFWSPSNLVKFKDPKIKSARCALIYAIDEKKILKIDLAKLYIQYVDLMAEDELKLLSV